MLKRIALVSFVGLVFISAASFACDNPNQKFVNFDGSTTIKCPSVTYMGKLCPVSSGSDRDGVCHFFGLGAGILSDWGTEKNGQIMPVIGSGGGLVGVNYYDDDHYPCYSMGTVTCGASQ